MELLKVEPSVQRPVLKPVGEIQLELLKLHRPSPKVPPPKIKPERRWLWLARSLVRGFAFFLNVFSVRGGVVLHREVGPGLLPERVERKEGRPRFY